MPGRTSLTVFSITGQIACCKKTVIAHYNHHDFINDFLHELLMNKKARADCIIRCRLYASMMLRRNSHSD